jgi:hypothetical protein
MSLVKPIMEQRLGSQAVLSLALSQAPPNDSLKNPAPY